MTQLELLNQRDQIIGASLSAKQQELIYFRSIRNFIIYFDKLGNEAEKEKVTERIDLYFRQIEENNFSYSISEKRQILKEFIHPIAIYYITRFHFKFYVGIKYSIFIGLNIDAVLLIFGASKHIYYVPIATLIFFFYWFFVELFYARKNKVY